MIYLLSATAVTVLLFYYKQSKKPFYKIGDAVLYQKVLFYIVTIEVETGNIHIRNYSNTTYYPRLVEKRVHISEIKPYTL